MQVESCAAMTVIDRINPDIRHFQCLNGLIVISNLNKNEVDDLHIYNVTYIRKIGKAGKEYGVLDKYEVIHEPGSPRVVDEKSEVTYNKYGDHYIRTVTTHRLMVSKCRYCAYEEMKEDTETQEEEVDIISIDGIPYLLKHNYLNTLERLNTPAPEVELEYISVYDCYIPENFIDEGVMSRVEELVMKVEELDKTIQYLENYDVYLEKIGKLAKMMTNEAKEYDPQRDLQHITRETYYLLDDGTKLTKEIVKERKYRCGKRATRTDEGEWVPYEDCESAVKEVVESHDYGEIPVVETNDYINYKREKNNLTKMIKNLLQQMVTSKVRINVQRNGERITIKVDDGEGEFMYNWMSRANYYRGKYGPLAMLFA